MSYQVEYETVVSNHKQVGFDDALLYIKDVKFSEFKLCSNFDEALRVDESNSTLSSIIAERLTRIYEVKGKTTKS